MDSKAIFFKFLTLIVLLFAVVGCEEPCQLSYSPILPFTVYPADRDTINVGDTLWLRSDVKTSIKDYENGNTYQYRNFNFRLALSLEQFQYSSDNKPSVPVPEKFTAGTKIGSIELLKTLYSITTEYKNDQYQLLGYIVPRDTGTYVLSVFSFIGGPEKYRTKINVTDSECHEYFYCIMPQINKGNTKQYLAGKDIPLDSPLLTKLQEWYYTKSSYYFYVKP